MSFGRDYEGTGAGWFCTYTPEEVLIAAGLVPKRIFGRCGPVEFADSYLGSNLCPYVRSCLDEALSGELGRMDCVVVATSCNSMCHLYNVWRKYTPTPFVHVLDVPRARDPAALAYFESEIRGLVRALEGYLGCRITDEALWEAYEICEALRAELRRLYELRRGPAPPVSGSEVARILRMAMTSPKREFVDFLSAELDRLDALSSGRQRQGVRDDGGQHPPGDRRPRVLLAGSLCELPLVDLIEESGALVVYDDLCFGSRYFMDDYPENSSARLGDFHPPDGVVAGGMGVYPENAPPSGDPIRAIARRYLMKVPCARMSYSIERLELLKGRIREFGVQGVIFYVLKFCDNYLYEYPVWKEALTGLGVPVLLLEGDYTAGGVEQIRNRTSAFVEMLGGDGR